MKTFESIKINVIKKCKRSKLKVSTKLIARLETSENIDKMMSIILRNTPNNIPAEVWCPDLFSYFPKKKRRLNFRYYDLSKVIFPEKIHWGLDLSFCDLDGIKLPKVISYGNLLLHDCKFKNANLPVLCDSVMLSKIEELSPDQLKIASKSISIDESEISQDMIDNCICNERLSFMECNICNVEFSKNITKTFFFLNCHLENVVFPKVFSGTIMLLDCTLKNVRLPIVVDSVLIYKCEINDYTTPDYCNNLSINE